MLSQLSFAEFVNYSQADSARSPNIISQFFEAESPKHVVDFILRGNTTNYTSGGCLNLGQG